MQTRSAPFPRWRYREFRTLAEQLRKKGWSYKEIRVKVPVSKSTLSEWCRDIPLSKAQIARLGSLYDTQLRGAKANQQKSAERKRAVREQAINELVGRITPDVLRVAGAMLYWAEGSKQGGTALANSDPTCVVFYVKWLQNILDIPVSRLTAHLHLHEGQDEHQEKIFWSQLTGIPLANFRKSFYKPVGTGHRKNVLYHGTIRVSVRGQGVELLRHRILGWAEAIARHFVSQKVIEIHYRGRTGR